MDEEIDIFRLRLIREGKEKSKALPQSSYGDPAKQVKFASEKGNKDAGRNEKREKAVPRSQIGRHR